MSVKKDQIIDVKNKIVLKSQLPNLQDYQLVKIVRRDNSPLFNSLMRIGSVLINPELNFDSRMLIHIVLDKDIYYDENDLKRLENIMLNKAKS